VNEIQGAALAANNPSDRDEFAAEAAPTKLKISVFSVTSVAKIQGRANCIKPRTGSADTTGIEYAYLAAEYRQLIPG